MHHVTREEILNDIVQSYTEHSDGSVTINSELRLQHIDFDPYSLNIRKVKGDVIISDINVTSLEWLPRHIPGQLNIQNMPKLTSLKGCPDTIGGTLYLMKLKYLSSLEGISPEIREYLLLSDLPALGTLKGLENSVIGVAGNQMTGFSVKDVSALKNYKYLPGIIHGTFHPGDIDTEEQAMDLIYHASQCEYIGSFFEPGGLSHGPDALDILLWFSEKVADNGGRIIPSLKLRVSMAYRKYLKTGEVNLE